MAANPSSTTKTSTVTDPKTGQTYATPSYSAFSFKGLTSTDPANVARNREAAAMYAAKGITGGSSGGGSGGFLFNRLRPGPDSGREDRGGQTSQSQLTSAQLAALGAPTASVVGSGPVEVPTPDYGLASLVPRPDVQPTFNYGQAFANPPLNYNLPQYMSLMDIFNTFPNFGQMA